MHAMILGYTEISSSWLISFFYDNIYIRIGLQASSTRKANRYLTRPEIACSAAAEPQDGSNVPLRTASRCYSLRREPESTCPEEWTRSFKPRRDFAAWKDRPREFHSVMKIDNDDDNNMKGKIYTYTRGFVYFFKYHSSC